MLLRIADLNFGVDTNSGAEEADGGDAVLVMIMVVPWGCRGAMMGRLVADAGDVKRKRTTRRSKWSGGEAIP